MKQATMTINSENKRKKKVNDINTGYMLTTVDNPFNPFTDWDNWNRYDTDQGYHTNELLARYTYTSIDLTEEDNEEARQQAIDDVINDDVTGKYIKIGPNDRILRVNLDEGGGG